MFLSYSCHFLCYFFIFCNEMQQLCNRQGKHTAAAHYVLGGQSLTAAFKWLIKYLCASFWSWNINKCYLELIWVIVLLLVLFGGFM